MHSRAPRVAFVTCAELPDGDADSRALVPLLAARGIAARIETWDAAVDWTSFDLVIVRSCWDYPGLRAEFLAWAARVPHLANPAQVLAWNTDKRYLAELEARGIPVVPTTWLPPGDEWSPPEPVSSAEWVVKPSVSLASLDTGRYDLRNGAHRRLAASHVRRLQRAGRVVMVQPYLDSVDTDGETSLVFIDGALSHTMRRGAALDGPDRGLDRRFDPHGGLDLAPRVPTPAQRDLAERALALVPTRGDPLLYARVDLVQREDGRPCIMEVELTEPNLFLLEVSGAAERFVSAVEARV